MLRGDLDFQPECKYVCAFVVLIFYVQLQTHKYSHKHTHSADASLPRGCLAAPELGRIVHSQNFVARKTRVPVNFRHGRVVTSSKTGGVAQPVDRHQLRRDEPVLHHDVKHERVYRKLIRRRQQRVHKSSALVNEQHEAAQLSESQYQSARAHLPFATKNRKRLRRYSDGLNAALEEAGLQSGVDAHWWSAGGFAPTLRSKSSSVKPPLVSAPLAPTHIPASLLQLTQSLTTRTKAKASVASKAKKKQQRALAAAPMVTLHAAASDGLAALLFDGMDDESDQAGADAGASDNVAADATHSIADSGDTGGTTGGASGAGAAKAFQPAFDAAYYHMATPASPVAPVNVSVQGGRASELPRPSLYADACAHHYDVFESATDRMSHPRRRVHTYVLPQTAVVPESAAAKTQQGTTLYTSSRLCPKSSARDLSAAGLFATRPLTAAHTGAASPTMSSPRASSALRPTSAPPRRSSPLTSISSTSMRQYYNEALLVSPSSKSTTSPKRRTHASASDVSVAENSRSAFERSVAAATRVTRTKSRAGVATVRALQPPAARPMSASAARRRDANALRRNVNAFERSLFANRVACDFGRAANHAPS
jgi:hypothetical protein